MNECDVNPCQDICINSNGSYVCQCFDGRTLVNGTICNGNDELDTVIVLLNN